MKYLAISVMLFVATNVMGQKLNVKFLEQAATISFVDIDRFMVLGNAFEKIGEDEGQRSKTYGKMFNKNVDNFIFVKLVNTKSRLHSIDISVSEYFDMNNFKNDVLNNDYLHIGINKQGFLIYRKDNTAFLISQTLNSGGAYQILFLSGN